MGDYFSIKNLKVNHKTFEGTKSVLNIDQIEIERKESINVCLL